MLSARTTVVAVLGDDDVAEAAVERLAGARNVRRVDRADPVGEDAVAAALVEAARTRAPYAVQRLDPLGAVAAAWERFFDGRGGHGELEVAVADTLRRWRAGLVELPDYYLAVGAAAWPPTRRHWLLGVLHPAAPARVVPVAARPAPHVLTRLEAGRWWPPLDRVLERVTDRAPDEVRAEAAQRGAGLLDPAGGAHPPASELLVGDDEDDLGRDPVAPDPPGQPGPGEGTDGT